VIEERLQAAGSWQIKLREDTPRDILDLITPFSMVAVFSSASPLARADSAILNAARYVGIVHKPGPQQQIGGPGLAAWLGQDTTAYDCDGTATLPESLAASSAGATLNTWLDSHVIPGTPFTRGTTGPTGTMVGSFQWVPQRAVLDALCARFAAEWRINPDLTLDVADYATLYGATPTVVISRTTSGREILYTSLHGEIDSSVDVADYASRVVVLGAAGRAASGGSSPWKGPEDVAVKVTRIVDSPDVPAGAESAAAGTYVALFNSLRREVSLSTDEYDISGALSVGSLVYLYDPETGITDHTAQLWFRGETIHPVTVRCMGLSWPVTKGMGVALRTNDGGVKWTDLSRFVEYEAGSTRVEIGAAQPFAQNGDQLSLRADLRPRLEWSPWQPCSITWAASITNPTLGNGTIEGRYRRVGTVLELNVTLTMGATTTYGAGVYAFVLPNSLGGAGTASQTGHLNILDVSAGQRYAGTTLIFAGFGNVWLFDNGSPLANLSATYPITFAAGDVIDVTLRAEVA